MDYKPTSEGFLVHVRIMWSAIFQVVLDDLEVHELLLRNPLVTVAPSERTFGDDRPVE